MAKCSLRPYTHIHTRTHIFTRVRACVRERVLYYYIHLRAQATLAEYSNNIMIRPIPVPAFFPPRITRHISMDPLNSDNFYFLTIQEAPAHLYARILCARIATVSRAVCISDSRTHAYIYTHTCVCLCVKTGFYRKSSCKNVTSEERITKVF